MLRTVRSNDRSALGMLKLISPQELTIDFQNTLMKSADIKIAANCWESPAWDEGHCVLVRPKEFGEAYVMAVQPNKLQTSQGVIEVGMEWWDRNLIIIGFQGTLTTERHRMTREQFHRALAELKNQTFKVHFQDSNTAR